MLCLSCVYVVSMLRLCCVYVVSKLCLCCVYGVSMFCLWFVYVLSMLCLCYVYVVSVSCLCRKNFRFCQVENVRTTHIFEVVYFQVQFWYHKDCLWLNWFWARFWLCELNWIVYSLLKNSGYSMNWIELFFAGYFVNWIELFFQDFGEWRFITPLFIEK